MLYASEMHNTIDTIFSHIEDDPSQLKGVIFHNHLERSFGRIYARTVITTCGGYRIYDYYNKYLSYQISLGRYSYNRDLEESVENVDSVYAEQLADLDQFIQRIHLHDPDLPVYYMFSPYGVIGREVRVRGDNLYTNMNNMTYVATPCKRHAKRFKGYFIEDKEKFKLHVKVERRWMKRIESENKIRLLNEYYTEQLIKQEEKEKYIDPPGLEKVNQPINLNI